MNLIDFTIFIVYMALVFLVGLYFYRKNKTREDYYVGGRKIKPFHVGLSVVATDVGGGFSIGLGGLGFVMGLSGTWLLFSGLIGAWLAAVFLIPKIKKIDKKFGMLTFPDFLGHKFGPTVALIAAFISGIGYLGFTGGQVLAGAKLASGTLFSDLPINIDPMTFSILIIAGVILIYTVLGGLNAVIFTDTIQWIILLIGLIFLALPFAYFEIGGWNAFVSKLPPERFSFTNVTWVQVFNWMITIIPIWLVGMTLYQRIFATKNEKDAKKAWYIAGIFEWPIMAFAGVLLGMFASIYFPESEPEMGLPRLLQEVLPIGLRGIVIAAYFSAIMSTADSCLIASSGNFVNDFYEKHIVKNASQKHLIRASQIVTLGIGVVTIFIASAFTQVLDVILHAYSFMVAGLFVPTIMAYFAKKHYKIAAITSMVIGGSTALFLIFGKIEMPLGLDPTFYGLLVSTFTYLIVKSFENPIE